MPKNLRTLYQKNRQRLTQRAEQSLMRTHKTLDVNGVGGIYQGQNIIQFASNDYLGLSNDTDIKNAFKTALDNNAFGAGASHLISGHTSAHKRLERELAEFMNYPRALVCSTGYMANLAMVCGLLSKGDALAQDKLNHASLIDAGQLAKAQHGIAHVRYQHVDVQSLAQQLGTLNDMESVMVATDGVFSMDGTIAPLDELSKTCKAHNATLAVDDAHGIGVLGQHGRGSVEHFGLPPQDAPLVMGALGKAFGGFGAFIVGDEDLIEAIIQFGRSYIYTTASPPALAVAHSTALEKIKTDTWRRDKLNDNIAYFKNLASELGIPLIPSDTAIQPVLIKQNEHAQIISQALLDKGFYAPAIRPPTVPKNTARLRVSLSASHSLEHINNLLQALAQHLFK